MFRIIVSPAFDRRAKRMEGQFDDHLQREAVLRCRSQLPLLDSAHVLIRRGVGPIDTIAIAHKATPLRQKHQQGRPRPCVFRRAGSRIHSESNNKEDHVKHRSISPRPDLSPKLNPMEGRHGQTQRNFSVQVPEGR